MGWLKWYCFRSNQIQLNGAWLAVDLQIPCIQTTWVNYMYILGIAAICVCFYLFSKISGMLESFQGRVNYQTSLKIKNNKVITKNITKKIKTPVYIYPIIEMSAIYLLPSTHKLNRKWMMFCHCIEELFQSVILIIVLLFFLVFFFFTC